jgi:hypothetical protein
LHDHASTARLYTRRVRSEVTISDSARPRSPPPLSSRTSPKNQLSQEGHLHAGRGIADEHELVGSAFDINTISNEEKQQQEVEQEVEQEVNKDYSRDED